MTTILVQQWRMGTTAPEWHTVGKAKTWRGAERIARREQGTERFGNLRHPDSGPKYGTIRATADDVVYRWDSAVGFVSSADDEAIDRAMEDSDLDTDDIFAREALHHTDGRQHASDIGTVTRAAIIDYDEGSDRISIRTIVRDNRIIGLLRREAYIVGPVMGWAPYTHHVVCQDEYGVWVHYLVAIA